MGSRDVTIREKVDTFFWAFSACSPGFLAMLLQTPLLIYSLHLLSYRWSQDSSLPVWERIHCNERRGHARLPHRSVPSPKLSQTYVLERWKQCFWLVPLDSPRSSQFTVSKLRRSRVQENNAVYSIHLISLNTCPMSHHRLVSASSSSNLSSSFLRNSHGWLVNSLSLKSCSMWIVDDPKLLDSCTYALKGVSPPVGGVAMSTMTAGKPYQDMRLAAWEKGAVCNESNADRYAASSSNCEAMFICDIFILLTLCIRKRLRRTVLEPVKLLVFGMHTQSPKSFYHDVMNKKRYLILCCSTTLEII